MDEGDDYVPQMSQMTDYTMMGGPPPQAQAPGVPQQQQRYPGQSMNPYEQQQHHQMMMMQQQQQHMHQMAPPVPQPAAPPAAPPAKKPRGKSKKAQAEAAAAAAAAAAQMDPMASMAAMSNNPMMRQNAYPNQMGMYGGAPPPPHYQATNGPAQQGYRPGPASGGPPQAQYPPQAPPPPRGYQQMYHQRAPGPPQPPPSQAQQAQPPGYSPYGYPPQGSSGYPPPPSQQSPYAPQTSHMRHQFPPHSQQQQAAPPGYWDGYQAIGGAQQLPQVPVTSQAMQHQDQYARTINELMNAIAQTEKSSAECKARIQQLYNLPRNAAADAEVQQLQHKLGQFRSDHFQYSQQLQRVQWQQRQQAGPQHHQAPPPTSVQSNQMTPGSSQQVPVHLNQTGSQVQLNITADKSRTLISVYPEGYGGGAGSGASSTESKESIVPPEPTTSSLQEQIPQVPSVPQVKTDSEKPPAYQQQQNLFGYPRHPPRQQPPQQQQPASVPMQHPSQHLQQPSQQHPSGYDIGSSNTQQQQASRDPRQQFYSNVLRLVLASTISKGVEIGIFEDFHCDSERMSQESIAALRKLTVQVDTFIVQERHAHATAHPQHRNPAPLLAKMRSYTQSAANTFLDSLVNDGLYPARLHEPLPPVSDYYYDFIDR